MGKQRLLGELCGVYGRYGKDVGFGNDAWWTLDYETFLAQRRVLMAQIIRKGHERLV
jgi:hypothetical protein